MNTLSPAPVSGPALRPLTETERLEALDSYQIMDSAPEQAFNDLARMAAFICGTPTSLVTFVDGKRQWFKAREGFDATETPREHAFCQVAMRSTNEVFEVADATQDPHFADNPLVTGDPHIRFYAGAPLRSAEGQPLGTLCAIDTVPRRLSSDQRSALRILARQAMTLLELRRTRLQLDDERQKLEAVLRLANSSSEALYSGGRTEIFVKQEQRLVRVSTDDLQYVEALGDYVNLYTTRERLTVYGTMKELEAKLPGRDFARVHRKYIVRLDRIVAIEADGVLLDSTRDHSPALAPVRVPIGHSYRSTLLGRLNLV